MKGKPEAEWEIVEETLRVELGPMTGTIIKRGNASWEWAVAPKMGKATNEGPPWQVQPGIAPLPRSKSPYTGFSAAGGNCNTRERAKEAVLGIIAAATYIYENEVGRIPDTSEDPT